MSVADITPATMPRPRTHHGAKLLFNLTNPRAVRIYLIILAFMFWEFAARFLINPIFSAPPSVVLLNMGDLLARPGLLPALLTMFWQLAAAFLLSIIVGLVVGLIVGSTRMSKNALFPMLMMLYGMPQITILPVILLTFGTGAASKIVFGVSHGAFPVLIATVASMNNLKPIFETSAYAMGANRWQRFRYVLLPHMVPGFFTGVRLSMAAVLIGVLLAELYASSAGIGRFVTLFSDSFDQKNLLGIVLIVAGIAMAFNALVRKLELHFNRWRG